MTELTEIVCNGLNSLIDKHIEISCGEVAERGLFLSYKMKEYYFELILKRGKYKKKSILFYPFCSKLENGVLFLNYKVSKFDNRFPRHLLDILMSYGNNHAYFNKIVRVHEDK